MTNINSKGIRYICTYVHTVCSILRNTSTYFPRKRYTHTYRAIRHKQSYLSNTMDTTIQSAQIITLHNSLYITYIISGTHNALLVTLLIILNVFLHFYNWAVLQKTTISEVTARYHILIAQCFAVLAQHLAAHITLHPHCVLKECAGYQ